MKKSLFLAFALLMFLTSCSNQILEEEIRPKLNQAGLLIFKDRKHFESVIKPLINQPESTLDEFERQNNFLSLRRSMDTGEAPGFLDEDGNPVVNSVALATMLNANGQIMIADSLFRIAKDGVYLSLNGKDQKLQALDEAPYPNPLSQTKALGGNLACPSSACFSNATCYDQYVHAGRTYRLFSKFYSDNFFFYVESGIRVRHQRREQFLWFYYWVNDAVNFIDVKAFACIGAGLIIPPTFPVPIAGNEFSYSNYLASTSNVQHVFNSGIVFNIRQCYWDVLGSFTYRRKSGTISSCIIN